MSLDWNTNFYLYPAPAAGIVLVLAGLSFTIHGVQEMQAAKSDASLSGADDYNRQPVTYRLVDPIAYTSSTVKNYKAARFDNDHILYITPGEYEPLGIVLTSNEDLDVVKTSIGDFRNAETGTFKAGNINTRIAKRWFQASNHAVNPDKTRRFLVHELLLHDENLVKTDKTAQKNFLRISVKPERYIDISGLLSRIPDNAYFVDAGQIQPFRLENGVEKLLWVTFHAPDDQKPGVYSGKLAFSLGNRQSLNVPLSVRVLPFHLGRPSLQYGLYYRARLTGENNAAIGSDYKTPQQYRLELQNMFEHGVLYPTLYEQLHSGNVPLALSLRNETGSPKDDLFVVGYITPKNIPAAIVPQVTATAQNWKDISASYGYKNVYLYGIDEAKGRDLEAQIASWRIIQGAGVRIFAACHAGAFDLVGKVLDLPVLATKSDYSEAEKWLEAGKKSFVYSNPQVGIEDPELYRQNYGFALWLSPYRGEMNYAYQHGFNDIWNDFDHERYRDHVFAYPTSKGVIDTVEWEGFREAIDDARYIDKLASIKGRQGASSILRDELKQLKTGHDVRMSVINIILNTTIH